MPFRARQKFRMAGCQVVTVPEQVTLESGEIVTESKDLCEEKMPDIELFDLKNQLEAGVELDEVNSKVLRNSKVDAVSVVRKYTKKDKSDVSTDN